MVKISANMAKKQPIPGVEISSWQIGAEIEVEVGHNEDPEAINQRLSKMYSMIEASIDSHYANSCGASNNGNGHAKPHTPSNSTRSSQPPKNGNGNGHNRSRNGTHATQAQTKCIYALCQDLGIDQSEVLADFNVTDTRDLHIRDASRLIDDLKARQAKR